jgi:hypothetical protein
MYPPGRIFRLSKSPMFGVRAVWDERVRFPQAELVPALPGETHPGLCQIAFEECRL